MLWKIVAEKFFKVKRHNVLDRADFGVEQVAVLTGIGSMESTSERHGCITRVSVSVIDVGIETQQSGNIPRPYGQVRICGQR